MKAFKILILILIGIGLMLTGFTIKNWALIEWDKKVKIYEVFQVISTLFIGIGIPFFLKKWVDDGRIVKDFLNDEAKDISEEAKKIKETILASFQNKQLTEDEKQYILHLFSQIENLLGVFEMSLINSFRQKYNSEFQDLKISYYTFWKNITEGDLMREDFNEVTLDFLSYYALHHNVFLNAIQTFKIKIQK